MKISVLIPTLGERPKELNRLLDSLANQQYKNFELVVVSQANHESVGEQLSTYSTLSVKHIKINKKGLSHARNVGSQYANGEIIVLSDDDCWYPETAFSSIEGIFEANPKAKICLTQIFDKENGQLYKNYSSSEDWVNNKLQLMSRSSIELAYRKNAIKDNSFDERFGLGGEFVCGEEIDFLLRNFEKGAVIYTPLVTVFHPKKNTGSTKQVMAKGALYKKHFGFFISLIVILRDLVIKKQNNIQAFTKGYRSFGNIAS